MGKQSNFNHGVQKKIRKYAASKNYTFVSVTGGGGSHHLYNTKVNINGVMTTFAVTVSTKNTNAYNQFVREIKRNESKIKQLTKEDK
jgi:hypothetical protein